jgi:CRP-like cAMP-binding protein
MLNPRKNELLDDLCESDFQILLPKLQLVSLVVGQTLYESGDRIEQVYFPVTALVAYAKELSDGLSIDMVLIGSEGVVGLRGLTGPSLHRVHVASSGLAYQISIHDLQEASSSMPTLFRMYVQAVNRAFKDVSIETACCHFHSIGQRLAKWLLIRHDHSDSPVIQVIHQNIADSLGVRREAITNALLKLPGIQSSRAQIEIKDRALLEEVCCECYFEQREAQPRQMVLPFHNAT